MCFAFSLCVFRAWGLILGSGTRNNSTSLPANQGDDNATNFTLPLDTRIYMPRTKQKIFENAWIFWPGNAWCGLESRPIRRGLNIIRGSDIVFCAWQILEQTGKCVSVCVCVCGEGWYWRSHKEMPCHITWTNMLWSTRFWPNWLIHQQQAARWCRERGREETRAKERNTRNGDGLRKCSKFKIKHKKNNMMWLLNL